MEAIFHLNQWSVGITDQVIWRDAQKIDSVSKQFGLINKLSLSAGYTWFGLGQMIFGVEQEIRGQNKQGGQWTGGDRIDHKLRATGNIRVGDRKTVSVTYSQLLPFLSNVNTMSYNTLGVSYIQAI